MDTPQATPIDPRRKEARRHVRNVRSFYVHAIVFLLVNLFLWSMNMLSNPGRLWFPWATLGWGFGLLCHGASVFVFRGFLGADWEERQIRAYLERRG